MKSETGRSRVYLPLFSGVAALIALIAIWLWVVGTQQTPLSPAETNTSSQITARQASIEIGLDSEPGLRELSSTVISVLSQGEFPSNASRNEPSALIATLLDSSQPLKLRRQAAWQLAKVGTSEALAALRQSLSNAPPQLRATIAEALGNCPDRQASAILKELLKDENEDVIRGAIRGLAANGNHAVVDIMSQLILSPKQTDGIRGEAALALGEIQGGDSLGTLVRLVSKVNERELTEALLSGLGRLPIEQTQEFFQRYLESSETEIDLRVAALEALGESAGAAAPFLIKYLQSEEAEIRAAAAWAIANLEAPGDVAGMLVSRLRSESEPEVRIRLYQALQNQERFDVGVTSVIATEQDLAARLAGYQLLAREVARGRDSALAVQFDQLVVPRLAELAISGASMNERLNAVVALKQANTPAAIRALAGISAKSGEAKIVQAATMN